MFIKYKEIQAKDIYHVIITVSDFRDKTLIRIYYFLLYYTVYNNILLYSLFYFQDSFISKS